MQTNWAPVVTALAVAIPVLVGILGTWLQSRSNADQLARVHQAVGDTHAVTVARVEQLEAALLAAHVAVPPHPPAVTS